MLASGMDDQPKLESCRDALTARVTHDMSGSPAGRLLCDTRMSKGILSARKAKLCYEWDQSLSKDAPQCIWRANTWLALAKKCISGAALAAAQAAA